MNTLGHILIVDDEPSVVYTLKAILEKVGYRISSAERMYQVKDALQTQEIDVIICDLGLADDVKGTDVLEDVVKIQPGIGRVLLTGYASPEMIDELEAKGISVFNKPVEMSRLLPELRRIIEQKAA